MNSADQNEAVQLKREIGLFSAINLILAVMIGSGIFVSPASALEYSGSVGMCIIVWILCGLVSLLGALCFAELGTIIVKSGAEYAYFREAFSPLHSFWGPLPSFLHSWIMVIMVRPAEVAVIILTFSQYFCQPLVDFLCIEDTASVRRLTKTVAIVALGAITSINIRSVKLYVKVQNIFGFCKVLACIIVILGGVYELFFKGNTRNLSKGFTDTKTDAKNIALAFFSGLWAFDGWGAVATVAEEVKKPEKNILRSILISVPIVTALYVFMNVAYMTVLTIPEMVQAEAVAVNFGERVFGPFAVLIPLGVAISTFGCALSVQFGVTRLCYVSARDGNMLEGLSYINYKRLTPAPAVAFHGIVCFFFILSGNIVQLIQFISFLGWFSYGTAMVALLVLRKTRKDIHRPYQVPKWIPIFIILVSVFLTVVPVVMRPDLKYLYAILFGCCGVPVYYSCIYKKKRPTAFLSKITYLIQVLFEAVPPEE